MWDGWLQQFENGGNVQIKADFPIFAETIYWIKLIIIDTYVDIINVKVNFSLGL